MKLFMWELRKIFSWKVVLLVVILNLLLFKLLVEFELEYFPNGRPGSDIFQVEKEMIEKYGEVIDEEEFQDYLATYEKRMEEADKFLQSNELAIAAGVGTYEEFRNGDHVDPAMNELHSHIMFEQGVDIFWELQAREYFIERYEHKESDLEIIIREHANSEREKQRAEEMLANEKFQYYDGQVLENFNRYSSQVALIILLSIAIVLSPIYVRDKMREVVPLQYTSKQGRMTFHTKWFAGLAAIGILLAVHLLIFGGLYLTNDTSRYFFMHVYSMSYNLVWYDITFGGYILLTIAVIIVLGYSFGMLTMAFSALVADYISQIGIQVLLIGGFAGVMLPIGLVQMISTKFLPWVVPVLYIFLIVVVFLFSRFVKKRELARDV